MKWWLWIAIAAAGALVLLVALALRDSPDPAGRAGGRGERHPPTQPRDEPIAPAARGGDPAADPADEETDDNRIRPAADTERWHYERFLRLAAADPEGFARVAGEKAASGAPLQERVALLRAAWKIRGKDALPWFADACAAAAGARVGDAAALRGFVVRHLASHARSVPEVRSFLWDELFLGGAVDPPNRSAAGRAVLEAADPAEIPALATAIRAVADAEVVEGALVGLGLNGDAAAATALDWLAANHPEERVRVRAAEVARQRLAGELPADDED